MAKPFEEIAVRSHDIYVASGQTRTAEFDGLTNIGAAVRIAIHIRGIPTIPYALLRQAASLRLGVHPAEVKPALRLLAEAEMVLLQQTGSTINTVVPRIPHYQNLYSNIGEVSIGSGPLNEHEQLTIKIMERLHKSPANTGVLTSLGAEKKALDRVLAIGSEAGFLTKHRARGQSVYLSPGYFSEDPTALADLTVTAGSSRLARVLGLLQQNQGYPLSIVTRDMAIATHRLDPKELDIINKLASGGFVPPPAIKTTHAGANHFIFGPRPGTSRLQPHQTQIYRNAISLVAAVRQGQFLSKEYAIRRPYRLVEAFKERGTLRSNSEAPEQYKAVVQSGLAYLEPAGNGQARLRLVANEDNMKALDMALQILSGESFSPAPDDELILAMKQGEEYVEPLLARKLLMTHDVVAPDEESQIALDDYLLRSSGQ